ncbi:MAG: hypothetical protein IT259_00970 [Saprospiraceae bacterium]|nr:hypothetical protein [Saprospiraceae bacterium]
MKRMSSIRVMQMLAVLAFMTFMGITSATAQSFLPTDQAVVKIDQTVDALTNPAPPTSNGTLQPATGAPTRTVTNDEVVRVMRINYLIDVKNQIKQGAQTGPAIEATYGWLSQQLNGRNPAVLNQTYNYVKGLLQQ